MINVLIFLKTNKKNILVFMITLIIGFVAQSQNSTCEKSEGDHFIELNTIGKCAIDNSKKPVNKVLVKTIRSRYVRKKTNFKNKINTKVLNEINKNDVKEVALNEVEKKKEIVVVEDVVRFDLVNVPPVLIECANEALNVKQHCFKENFSNHVSENFIYPFDAAADGIEGRVWVRFVVGKDGYVKDITAKGPENTKILEEEAKRMVELLPKFIPGKHNNEYANVSYLMPIDFELDE